MIRKMLSTVSPFVFMSLFAASCSQPSLTGSHTAPNENASGEAVIVLPQIPGGFLAKRAGEPLTLQLSISAQGMKTIEMSWPVSAIPKEPVIISNIPAGTQRAFEGTLFDSKAFEAYSGKIVTDINPGQRVNVLLKMYATAGAASVCIEIEGLPKPSCEIPDTIKKPELDGLWEMSYKLLDGTFRTGQIEVILKNDGGFFTGKAVYAASSINDTFVAPVNGFLRILTDANPVVYIFTQINGSYYHLNGYLDHDLKAITAGDIFKYTAPKYYEAGDPMPDISHENYCGKFFGKKIK